MKTITTLGATVLLAAVSAFSLPAAAQYRGVGPDDARARSARDHDESGYDRRRERREERREDRQERIEDRRELREDRREVREDRRDDRRDARDDRRDARDWRHDRRDVVIAPAHRPYGGYDRYDRGDRYYGDSRRHYAPRQYRPAYVYVAPRGYRVSRWNVGHRMPPPFYARPYYIDPLSYRLRTPPRGYRWVRVDRDVYLVSVASGLIADVLYGIFR